MCPVSWRGPIFNQCCLCSSNNHRKLARLDTHWVWMVLLILAWVSPAFPTHPMISWEVFPLEKERQKKKTENDGLYSASHDRISPLSVCLSVCVSASSVSLSLLVFMFTVSDWTEAKSTFRKIKIFASVSLTTFLALWIEFVHCLISLLPWTMSICEMSSFIKQLCHLSLISCFFSGNLSAGNSPLLHWCSPRWSIVCLLFEKSSAGPPRMGAWHSWVAHSSLTWCVSPEENKRPWVKEVGKEIHYVLIYVYLCIYLLLL